MPSAIIRTICAFTEFCYLVHHHVIDESVLHKIEDALSRFHEYHKAFRAGDNPVMTSFLLPRQHAAKHYATLIRLFSTPNGLCSSITECKHIKAVKEPYQRSNKYQALGQMLLTNQWLNKLVTSHVDFMEWGILDESCLTVAILSLGISLSCLMFLLYSLILSFCY